MSLRDNLLAVRSLDEIRKAVASQDADLRAVLAGKYQMMLAEEFGAPTELDEDETAEFQEQCEAIATALNQVVMSAVPPETEHGDWAGLFSMIADVKGLLVPCDLPLDGYKHLHTWGLYRKLLRGRIPDRMDGLLRLIEEGRPLIGKTMESDWSMYSWLDRAEIADLLQTLSDVEFGGDDGSGLTDFHTDFLASLTWLHKNDVDVLLLMD